MNWTLAVAVRAVLGLPGHCIPLWCSHPTVRSLFGLQKLFLHASVRNKVCFALPPCCGSTQTGNCSEKNWTSVVILTLSLQADMWRTVSLNMISHHLHQQWEALWDKCSLTKLWLSRQDKISWSVEAGVPLLGSVWTIPVEGNAEPRVLLVWWHIQSFWSSRFCGVCAIRFTTSTFKSLLFSIWLYAKSISLLAWRTIPHVAKKFEKKLRKLISLAQKPN